MAVSVSVLEVKDEFIRLNAPLPLMALARVMLLPLMSRVPPPVPMGPNRLEISTVFAVAHWRPPPFIVMVPLLKTELLANLISPEEIKVWVCPTVLSRVKIPVPCLTSVPANWVDPVTTAL